MIPPPPRSTLFPYTTLFRSRTASRWAARVSRTGPVTAPGSTTAPQRRSEEHTSELQSLTNLVCRLLLEKKKKKKNKKIITKKTLVICNIARQRPHNSLHYTT